MQQQPYRQGARQPSQALDAMRAGGSTPYPGAAAGAKKQRAPGPTHGPVKTVLVPRVSARSRNLRRDGR